MLAMDLTNDAKLKASDIIEKYKLKAPFSIFDIAQLEAFTIKFAEEDVIESYISKDQSIQSIDLSNNQLIGYYNESENTLFLVEENNKTIEKQRYSIAHELGHKLFDHKHAVKIIYESDLYNYNDDEEEAIANTFAGYLLAPDNDISETLQTYKNFYEGDLLVNKLADIFIIDTKFMRKRLSVYYSEHEPKAEEERWIQKIWNLTTHR